MGNPSKPCDDERLKKRFFAYLGNGEFVYSDNEAYVSGLVSAHLLDCKEIGDSRRPPQCMWGELRGIVVEKKIDLWTHYDEVEIPK